MIAFISKYYCISVGSPPLWYELPDEEECEDILLYEMNWRLLPDDERLEWINNL